MTPPERLLDALDDLGVLPLPRPRLAAPAPVPAPLRGWTPTHPGEDKTRGWTPTHPGEEPPF